ncbi:MAG: TrkA family potassium uptake protein [Deltaproteobacteria bacterium]|nr:TrkA family potassium uptake protein [Deltaproteobacteria bacterium]
MPSSKIRRRQKRTPYAYVRYALYLLREFRGSILAFAVLLFGGGAIISAAYSGKDLSYPEAIYDVFMLVFMESALEFPKEWFLQPLWFLFPIVGLFAIADSVVRLGYMVFARKEKLQEWHVMHASSLRDHFIVVGVGRVGSRIIKELLALGESVVGVDQKQDGQLIDETVDLGVPVIQGDIRLKKTLELAGVQRAKAVIFATDDDLANLDGALTAREIRSDIRVVLRIFDETLATKVATNFDMPAISTSTTSAPSFIAAATGRSVLAGFRLGLSETLHVADVAVSSSKAMEGRSVGHVQQAFGVNIVLHQRGTKTLENPGHDFILEQGDRLLVIAPIDRIARLEGRA